MLFSEPKISQSCWLGGMTSYRRGFQCSSASRKFLNRRGADAVRCEDKVSVLFSEPKISQFIRTRLVDDCAWCFSALQRAENFSILGRAWRAARQPRFQCSSASRKFLNRSFCAGSVRASTVSVLFSEPKISQSVYLNVAQSL